MTEHSTFDSIEWHLFFNTAKDSAAEVIILRLEKLLDAELEAVSFERYWKDPKLTDARFRSRIEPVNGPADAVYTFLLTIGRLAQGFSTSGPQTYENGAVEISAYASSGFTESGVKWMEASIRNFRPTG